MKHNEQHACTAIKLPKQMVPMRLYNQKMGIIIIQLYSLIIKCSPEVILFYRKRKREKKERREVQRRKKNLKRKRKRRKLR